jgi:hypothetical protein
MHPHSNRPHYIKLEIVKSITQPQKTKLYPPPPFFSRNNCFSFEKTSAGQGGFLQGAILILGRWKAAGSDQAQ